MDWPGAVLACSGLFAIVFGFSRAETAGWTAGVTLGFLAGGVVLLAGLVLTEGRGQSPSAAAAGGSPHPPGRRCRRRLPFPPGGWLQKRFPSPCAVARR